MSSGIDYTSLLDTLSSTSNFGVANANTYARTHGYFVEHITETLLPRESLLTGTGYTILLQEPSIGTPASDPYVQIPAPPIAQITNPQFIPSLHQTQAYYSSLPFLTSAPPPPPPSPPQLDQLQSLSHMPPMSGSSFPSSTSSAHDNSAPSRILCEITRDAGLLALESIASSEKRTTSEGFKYLDILDKAAKSEFARRIGGSDGHAKTSTKLLRSLITPKHLVGLTWLEIRYHPIRACNQCSFIQTRGSAMERHVQDFHKHSPARGCRLVLIGDRFRDLTQFKNAVKSNGNRPRLNRRENNAQADATSFR